MGEIIVRSLCFTNKKLRGQRRLFRWLRGWANSFSNSFPSSDMLESPYWNWKIPVPCTLVEGRRARKSTVIQCAQLLLDATANLAASRPEWAKGCRAACVIVTPEVFGSEVCLYMNEEYFQNQISPAREGDLVKELVTGKSLAQRWGLNVPPGFQELGLQVVVSDPEDGDYRNEWWFFGELA